MLKMLRVDDRLIHGQVAFSWVSATSSNCIVVANDRYATNAILKMTLNVGKPTGVKLEVLTLQNAIVYMNNEKYKQRKIMLVTETIQDALIVSREVGDVKEICLGGIREEGKRKYVCSQIFLDEADIKTIETLQQMGIRVYAQPVPSNPKVECEEMLQAYHKG